MIRGLRALALAISLPVSLHAQETRFAPLTNEQKTDFAGKTVQLLSKHQAPKGSQIKTQIMEGSRFVLWGDLFEIKRPFAIVADGDATIIAEHTQKGWEVRAVWNIPPCWLPPGLKKEDLDYYHLTPPNEPFKLKSLDGAGPNELLIAFPNDGYAVGYYIARWSEKKNEIELLDVRCETGEPNYLAGHLITYDAMKRKSWWGETTWHRWEKEAPVFAARIYEDAHDPEKSWDLYTVRSPDTGKETHFRSLPGNPTVITLAELGKDHQKVTKETPYAKVTFHWKKEPGDAGAQQLYLFEKLCGIPSHAFGKTINGITIAESKKLQADFTVEVTGTPEAIKRFKK